MINNIYTFYKFDTTTFRYVGRSKSTTNKTNKPGFTIDKPPKTARGHVAVYTGGVGPWVDNVDPKYSMVDERIRATSKINARAEARRAQEITPYTIQNMVYLEKYTQATAYVAAGYPNNTKPYPFVEVDVDVLSKTATEAADDIISAYTTTTTFNVLVERYRMQANIAVAAASNDSDLDQAVSDFNDLIDAI